MIDMAGPVGLLAPADLLPRLLARLTQAPPLAFAADELPPALPPGLVVLDATCTLQTLPQRLDALSRSGVQLVDFHLLFDHPVAEQYGWMIAAGGTAAALDQAAAWLDRLAPVPSGWLRAGAPGAGCLFGQLATFWTQQQSDTIQWLSERGPHGVAMFDPASWQAQAGKYVPAAIQAAQNYLMLEAASNPDASTALSPASILCRTLLASVHTPSAS
ncbi:hypothetical protein GCM10007860_10390 [Chitiniphilus shinanonensis]|uniref:Uncharacterized protein n=1 Tax=Chitiniphilus shinanonensis TaxID=553088 RepID=A0ABQ6BVU6_9NEIS|nr:hypothetical protein [Chitiniphilus shinanonensis]GLS03894.1 hypothetical protein GCM10007860_10390 [Chitiniphilus shinanonensis]